MKLQSLFRQDKITARCDAELFYGGPQIISSKKGHYQRTAKRLLARRMLLVIHHAQTFIWTSQRNLKLLNLVFCFISLCVSLPITLLLRL